jgi:hypothetical protein
MVRFPPYDFAQPHPSALRGAPNISPCAITLDERDDRVVGYLQLSCLNRDFFTIRGDFNDRITHGFFSLA